MKNYIFYLDCLVLIIVPGWFILNRVYQDGVIGRLALGGIVFAAATFLMEAGWGSGYDMLPQTVLLVTSFAVFLVWHLFRFHRRVLKQKREACAPVVIVNNHIGGTSP